MSAAFLETTRTMYEQSIYKSYISHIYYSNIQRVSVKKNKIRLCTYKLLHLKNRQNINQDYGSICSILPLNTRATVLPFDSVTFSSSSSSSSIDFVCLLCCRVTTTCFSMLYSFLPHYHFGNLSASILTHQYYSKYIIYV